MLNSQEDVLMDTRSLWQAISVRKTDYPELEKNLEVDVAIIGGGITGITAATQLINAGKKVAILEADKIGGVTTSLSTGNLYIAVQPFYQNIYSKFNLETAKTIAQSRKFAIDYIEKNIREKNINCHFHRRPWYAYTNKDPRISLDKEVELLKKMDVEIGYTNNLPLAFKFKKAIVMQNQARFNPLQYVISMADDLSSNGCHIFENTRVIEITEKDFCTLTTKNAKIKAKKVFMATHTPIGINSTQVFTAPYRSYVVAVRLKENNYPEGHFWDLDRPPHATCTHAMSSNDPELLLVAGSHHKTGQGSDMELHYNEMETFLRDHFPVAELAFKWSAQHYQSADNVPYIGLASRFSKHTFIATGYFADGLVYGTLAGIIIGDSILDKDNSLVNTYQAQRFTPIASAGFLAKEGSNVFLQYLKDYPLFKSSAYQDIKIGEGKIVKINGEKCAVWRDDKNELHAVSAVCTHMKCLVNWNNAEKTWDCPCHGSRFTCAGKVIEGPAMLDLEPKKI
jgi:glycine/D-amino acid oxidase-like deaminating enzyme/nitrite reductase/ring-hydroxylating ferredoxin subunit